MHAVIGYPVRQLLSFAPRPNRMGRGAGSIHCSGQKVDQALISLGIG